MPPPSSQQPSPGKRAIPILIRDLPTQASCNPEPIVHAAQQSELAPAPSQRERALRDATWAIEDLDHEDFVDDLSEEYLREVAGTDDLQSLTYLELTIDTTDQSVEPLGRMLPNIAQLKLNHSRLASFRDLGTQLRNLRILWLNRSGVTELDGVGALTGLKELYLAFNKEALTRGGTLWLAANVGCELDDADGKNNKKDAGNGKSDKKGSKQGKSAVAVKKEQA